MGIYGTSSKNEEKTEKEKRDNISDNIDIKEKVYSIKNEGLYQGMTESIKIDDLKIIEKHNENSVCKIINVNKVSGTGFLALIPFPDKLKQLPVLITCNHVIKGNEKETQLIFNDNIHKTLILDEKRIIHIDKMRDIIMIELKNEDNIYFNNLLEIDYDIFETKGLNEIFKSIYIIHFPFIKEPKLSIGSIENIIDEVIEHKCSTDNGSSGAPIINLKNNKVIGVHRGTEENMSLNIGILLTSVINDLNKIKNKNQNEENKILFNNVIKGSNSKKNKTKENIVYLNISRNEYEGNNKNDNVEGKGIYHYKNGDYYIGDLKNDKKEGKGTYYYNNGKNKGKKYEGDYKNDKREGKGIFYYNNGDRYEGDYKNDCKEGKGSYYFNNGNKFEGEYKNDKREGKGIYYTNKGRYESIWKNGKREGKIIYLYNNGDMYEGDYKKGKMEGKGIYYYKNGNIYEGDWKNNKREGNSFKSRMKHYYILYCF